MSEGKSREDIVSAAAQTLPSPAAAIAPPAEWSLETVFRDHHSLVFRAAYRVTGNGADAEDVLQTVFYRLARREPGEVASVESYLYRAAVNAALDVMRSRQSAAALPLDEIEGELSVEAGASPGDEHDAAELKQWMRRTVARLSARTAEIFALRYFEDRDNAEIARILGTSEGTVAVTLHRARQVLLREWTRKAGGKS
jgi:RNA polymerase sigma factor (sigma-70 family)